MASGENMEKEDGDAEMVLAMVTSAPLKNSGAGAILLG